MTLKFYTVYGGKLLATWDNYPIIPNVGDRISINHYQYEVQRKVFFEDCIHIMI